MQAVARAKTKTAEQDTPPKPLTAEKLAAYYAENGSSGSLFGAMAALALSISHTSVKCRVCDGTGIRELSRHDLQGWATAIAAEEREDRVKQLRADMSAACTCPVCRGCGYTTQRRADRASAMDKMFTTVRCGRCRGCGEAVPPTDTSAEREDVCLRCGGAAYIVPITARARGSTNSGGSGGSGVDPDEGPNEPGAMLDVEALVERGKVREAIERVAERDPEVAAAMGSYFGPPGDQWAHHRWSRTFALWAHTAIGPVIAQEHVVSSPSGRFVDRLALIAAARHTAEEIGRGPVSHEAGRMRALLAECDRQARALFGRMHAEIG